MQAFRTVGVYTERFASPLNVHESTRLYYSAYKEDEAFGAVHDAYSAPFLTPSQINPEYTAEQLNKALKHAVQSTYLDAPQLHLLVYPVWAAEPYKKWLRHPRVHQLCRIPRGQFSFIPYDHFTGKERKAKEDWAKWDVDLLLVANPAGLAEWYRHEDLAAAVREAVGDLELVIHKPEEHMWTGEAPKLKGLAKAARRFDAGDLADLPEGPQRHLAGGSLPDAPPLEVDTFDTGMLRYDPDDYVYTDGSRLAEDDGTGTRTGLGAAVVRRNRVTYVNPVARDGLIRTINRAEMSALFVALMQGRDEAVLKILTDSQVSLQWILNELHRPMRTARLMHRDLLRAVVDLILERDRRGFTTFIGKVKAHAGIRGNDLADAAAKVAAERNSGIDANIPRNMKRRRLMMNENEISVEIGQHVPVDGPFVLEDGDAPGESPAQVTPAQAKPKIHSRLRTWGSNLEAVHYKMMCDMNDKVQRRLKAISSGYMTSPRFTHRDRCIIKRLLMGVFQTQSRDHMMRPTVFPSPQCVLCQGQHPGTELRTVLDSDCTGRDGCGHVMGGCTHPKLSAYYIWRHNEAVAMIAWAVANGSKGRWLQVVDLRKEALGKLSAAQRKEAASRVPAYMLPDVPEETRKKMRPDIMFVEGLDEGWQEADVTPDRLKKMQKTCKVFLLEIGYCRDNKAVQKRAEKKRQHVRLKQALVEAGWTVDDVPLVFGHCGSVYEHEREALQALGVTKNDTIALLRRLHEHAIKSTCAVARLYQQLRGEENRKLGYVWRGQKGERQQCPNRQNAQQGRAGRGARAWQPP